MCHLQIKTPNLRSIYLFNIPMSPSLACQIQDDIEKEIEKAIFSSRTHLLTNYMI